MADARALLKLIKGIPAKFNLIPFNKWPGAEFDCSDMADIKKFSDFIQDNGYSAPIRVPRGRDILAACGQLKSDSERTRCSRLKERLAAGIPDEHHAA
jgi:23S rRNA (adenine2503-C2)-methyltransferase